MEQHRFSRVIAGMEKEQLRELADNLAMMMPVEIVKEPQSCLVMMQARDTVEEQLFNVGEVLVTECTVKVGSTLGWSCLLGDDKEKSYWAAVIDGALACGEDLNNLIPTLLAEEEAQLKELRLEWQQIIKTRVNFDLMSGGETP